MTYGWYWIGIIVLAIIVEFFTEQLVSIWFVPGAVVATVIDFFVSNLAIEVAAFVLISALGIILTKIVFSNKNKKQDTKTNIDAIIGSKCIVTEKIDNFAGCGQAKVKGQIWSARGLGDDDVFEKGEVLRIVAIEGVKIICKKD